jgi:hypothetical protein
MVMDDLLLVAVGMGLDDIFAQFSLAATDENGGDGHGGKHLQAHVHSFLEW